MTSASGNEEDGLPRARQRRAEVDVLRVHEVALVEEADGLEIVRGGRAGRRRSPTRAGRARASTVRRGARPARIAADRGADRVFCRSSPSGLIVQPNDSSGSPVSIDEARTDGRDAPRRTRGAPTSVEIARRRHERVGIEQQHQVARGGANADVVAAREAEVAAGFDQLHRRPALAHELRRAVARAVVDDADACGERRLVRRRSIAGTRRARRGTL